MHARAEMIERRAFLQASFASSAALLLPACLASGQKPRAAWSRSGIQPGGCAPSLGLQLYTVRSAMAENFEGTLAAVAAAGYRDVEFAGYYGRSAAQVRGLLDRLSLISSSAHVPLSAFDEANLGKTLADAHTAGHRYLVISAIDPRTQLDGYRRAADQFNKAAAILAREGLGFAYHNHAFEFAAVDDQVPYDVLLEATDPALVMLEMDVYWITKAGRDPLDYFARWPGRFRLVHAKDTGGPPEHRMADVGSGQIDWPRIFAQREQAGIEHIFVERDDAPDPFASITASYAYLRTLPAAACATPKQGAVRSRSFRESHGDP